LLDLAALQEIHVDGSIFDPDYGVQLERATFLRTLGQRITRPVMPDDEAFDYIVTQVVADFLATNSANPIDGIIYRSAQTSSDARNVVLFHKAARVERFDRPYGTEVDSSLGHWTEDGWETDYEVIESVPPADAKEPDDPLDAMVHILGKGLHELDTDGRESTLRLDTESVRIYEIEAVAFQTHESWVRHFRWEKKGKAPFE
jgi:RES domain